MKKLSFTLSILICYVCAQAQITYHDINPDTTVNTWNAFVITPAASAPNGIIIWWHPSPEVVIQTNDSCEIFFDAAGTFPAKLDSGNTVNASGTWKVVNYDALNSGSDGNWHTNATDKYIGFRLKNGAAWNYGWLKMSIASGAASFTVKEWAYNTAGNAIKAGQTTTAGIDNIVSRSPLSLYPNPATNTIQLKMTVDENVQLSITDVNMNIISTVVITKRQHNPRIDISALPNGIYCIRAEKGSDIFTCMFVKQ